MKVSVFVSTIFDILNGNKYAGEEFNEYMSKTNYVLWRVFIRAHIYLCVCVFWIYNNKFLQKRGHSVSFVFYVVCYIYTPVNWTRCSGVNRTDDAALTNPCPRMFPRDTCFENNIRLWSFFDRSYTARRSTRRRRELICLGRSFGSYPGRSGCVGNRRSTATQFKLI